MARLRLRPEVLWFAEHMERRLRVNDHKGGWHDCGTPRLMHRLFDEVCELHAATYSNDFAGMIQEAADAANFAMMVADIADEYARRAKREGAE